MLRIIIGRFLLIFLIIINVLLLFHFCKGNYNTSAGAKNFLFSYRDRPFLPLKSGLTNDPQIGIARHADAGYQEAIEFAKKAGIKIPMLKG